MVKNVRANRYRTARCATPDQLPLLPSFPAPAAAHRNSPSPVPLLHQRPTCPITPGPLTLREVVIDVRDCAPAVRGDAGPGVIVELQMEGNMR